MLLVSKNTIQAFCGVGGGGGGFDKDMFWVDSPHADTTNAIAAIANKDLSICRLLIWASKIVPLVIPSR